MSDRIKNLFGEELPIPKELFLERLWSLRPHGNVEEAYIQAAYAVKSRKTFRDEPITLDLLVEKYSEYLAQCRMEGRASKWIASIASFIQKGMFNSEFEKPDDNDLNRLI